MNTENARANPQPTIKDISAKLNVSAVSVHRALSGKEGVSDKLRRRVLQTAKEMGYEVNYAAASLKRKARRVAVVLPQDEGLYYAYLWKGIEASAREVKALNVEVEEFVSYNEDHQYELLKQIADAKDEYSGVITFSYSRQPRVLLQMQRLVSQGIVTVIIDDEMKEPEGLYCIPSNEKTLGRVAGEFVSLISPETGSVLVTSGRLDSKIHINKVQSFVQYLAQEKPGLKVRVVEGYFNTPESHEAACALLRQELRAHPDTVAVYALTSNDNLNIVESVRKENMEAQVSVIGTDLNTVTTRLLREGRLKAVINQASYIKGYKSLNVLVDRVVKNIEPPLRLDCPIDVVLKSNLSFYERSNNI